MEPNAYWTAYVEAKFVDLMADASINGRIRFGVSNKDVFCEIASTLHGLTRKRFSYTRILSKLNELQARYDLWQGITLQTGVTWDHELSSLVATEDVWNVVLEEKPSAIMYKSKGEPHWLSLTFIFGGHLRVQSMNDNEDQDFHNEAFPDEDAMEIEHDEIIVISDDDNSLSINEARVGNEEVIRQGPPIGRDYGTSNGQVHKSDGSFVPTASSPAPRQPLKK